MSDLSKLSENIIRKPARKVQVLDDDIKKLKGLVEDVNQIK